MPVMNLTKENFQATVDANEIVILDFWAEWCGPCKRFAPIFEKMAEKFPKVTFGKIDTEAEQELAAHFQIQSIPMIMVVKQSQIIFAQPGALNEEVLQQVVEKAIEIDMSQVEAED